MKLTTQTKVYLGMLAVAAVAFVADRSFFSANPATAKPAMIRKSIVTSPAKIQVAMPLETSGNDEVRDLSSLSQRLQAAAKEARLNGDESRDPFAPPGAWLARAAEKARRSAPSPLDQFRAQHHLLAVMIGGRAAMAIIDGKTLAAGQSVDGFRLILITQQSATFESAEGRVELKIAK